MFESVFIRALTLARFSSSLCLEALSREFCTGCPWELLYEDDIMLSAESMSMEELLLKLKTLKSEMEKKGLQMNIGKTKVMASGLGFAPVEEI